MCQTTLPIGIVAHHLLCFYALTLRELREPAKLDARLFVFAGEAARASAAHHRRGPRSIAHVVAPAGSLGALLFTSRRALGMTQAEVAGACQVTPESVSRWESGEHRPSIAHTLTLARVLRIPGGQLEPFYFAGVDELPPASLNGRDIDHLAVDPELGVGES